MSIIIKKDEVRSVEIAQSRKFLPNITENGIIILSEDVEGKVYRYIRLKGVLSYDEIRFDIDYDPNNNVIIESSFLPKSFNFGNIYFDDALLFFIESIANEAINIK